VIFVFIVAICGDLVKKSFRDDISMSKKVQKRRSQLLKAGAHAILAKRIAHISGVPEFEYLVCAPLFSCSFPLIEEEDDLIVISNIYQPSVREIVALTEVRLFIFKEQMLSIVGWEHKLLTERHINMKEFLRIRQIDLTTRATIPGNPWADKVKAYWRVYAEFLQ